MAGEYLLFLVSAFVFAAEAHHLRCQVNESVAQFCEDPDEWCGSMVVLREESILPKVTYFCREYLEDLLGLKSGYEAFKPMTKQFQGLCDRYLAETSTGHWLGELFCGTVQGYLTQTREHLSVRICCCNSELCEAPV